ncbi:MAG TPA: ABC transporter permease [Bryobacteraceae bacterium]
MTWLSRLWRRETLERDLGRELQFHIEERISALKSTGLSEDEARRRVRQEFGGIEQVKEECRDARGTTRLASTWQDARYGLRLLRRRPGFSAIVIGTLAIGIGANTAIFSVVDGVLLRPLPYPHSDRLVRVWEGKPSKGFSRNVVNGLNFLDWRDRSHSFTQMAAIGSGNSNISGAGDPVAVPAMRVSPEFFSILGISAYLGRTFLPEEGKPGHSDSVILSYSFWQTHFGSDRGTLGRKITINGSPSTIVGVMPAGFTFPNIEADIWTPLPITRSKEWEGGRFLGVIARLKSGISLEKAQEDMTRVATQLANERPDYDKGWSAEVVPFLEDATTTVRLPLLVLLIAVGFVLLVACANLANLLLMRGTQRLPEIAIRAALGAGKLRLVQQLLSETLVLAMTGWGAGILVAYAALKGLLAIIPTDNALPRMQAIHLDARVFLFSFAIALLTTLLFGGIPAFRIAQGNVQGNLKSGSSRTGVGVNRGFRYAFVITEIALSLLLLAGAGLMLRSFAHLLAVNPGFVTDHVLTMNLFISTAKFGEPAQRGRYVDELLNEIRNVPGVQSAGSAHFLPMTGMVSGSCFSRLGEPLVASSSPVADFLVITPGYLRAMRIPLLAGRDFGSRDTFGAPSVVLINHAFATKYFPKENPIGQKLNICWTIKSPATIVGVVSDARQTDLQTQPRPTILLDNSQGAMYFANLTVRTREDAHQMTRSVVAAIHRINPDQAVSSVRSMDDVLSNSVARPRLQVILLATFAAIAVLLAALGVYGVLSYSVVQRMQEIGIRVAVGATAADVLRMILKEGMVLLAAGAGVGITATLLLTRLLKSLLFDVQPTDPLTLACVTVILIAVALVAMLIPARRALQVDPVIALRYE